jgi:hypothetical protein
MTNEEQFLAALEYQKAMRPAFGNPNLMRQGARMNLPARQAPGLFSEFGTQAMSLDPQPNQGYGTMAAEMALGFVPGVGQAMAARDIERARRDNDPLGMALAGLSLLPLGKLIGSLRGGKQMGPVSELDVYHGTPHRFPPTANNPLGEFDPMKIGTGEGAQAYGVGAAYLAENPRVAKTYNPNPGIAKDAYEKSLKYWEKDLSSTNPAYVEKAKKEIAILKEKIANQDGFLYKVDLPDEQIAKMLDWDKPLSQQAAGKAALDFIPSIAKPNMTGQQFHDALVEQVFGSGKRATQDSKGALAAANYMRYSLGIPGIKYLDEGSRAGGAGTSNFVVFDPKHMNIIERNGVTASDIMKQTVPESSLMYKDPFGGIE